MAKVELTPAFLDRLRGLAQNCQPPIWQLNEHSDVVSVAHTVAEVAYDEDAQFIAEANPATVLAMIARIRQLEEQIAVLSKIERDRWLQTAKMLGIKPEDVGYGNKNHTPTT